MPPSLLAHPSARRVVRRARKLGLDLSLAPLLDVLVSLPPDDLLPVVHLLPGCRVPPSTYWDVERRVLSLDEVTSPQDSLLRCTCFRRGLGATPLGRYLTEVSVALDVWANLHSRSAAARAQMGSSLPAPVAAWAALHDVEVGLELLGEPPPGVRPEHGDVVSSAAAAGREAARALRSHLVSGGWGGIAAALGTTLDRPAPRRYVVRGDLASGGTLLILDDEGVVDAFEAAFACGGGFDLHLYAVPEPLVAPFLEVCQGDAVDAGAVDESVHDVVVEVALTLGRDLERSSPLTDPAELLAAARRLL